MRLIIDMQGAQSHSAKRGIGRYTKALVKALLEQPHSEEVLLLWNANLLQEPIDEFRRYDVRNILFHAPVGTHWLDEVSILVREKVVCESGADVLLLSSLFEGIADCSVTSIKAWCQIPTAVIFYDLIPLIQSDYFFQNEEFKQWYLRKFQELKKADLFLAISDSSAKEALRYLGCSQEQVVTISSAVDAIPHDLVAKEDLQKRFGLHKPYIMHASACDERKNFKGLLRAFALLPPKLRQKYQLLLVCNPLPWQKLELQHLIKELGLAKDEVIFTGYVDDRTLFSLYKNAHLFVFPSLHEGFGLPILEAMHMDTPVIASDHSSMAEVVGWQEALFDPHDSTAIAQAIQKALEDSSFYEKLRQNSIIQRERFSWSQSAARAWDALRKLYAKKAPESKTPHQDFFAALQRIAPGCPSLCERRACAQAIARNEQALSE